MSLLGDILAAKTAWEAAHNRPATTVIIPPERGEEWVRETSSMGIKGNYVMGLHVEFIAWACLDIC